jgi:CHASE1-domain containing sensor protein
MAGSAFIWTVNVGRIPHSAASPGKAPDDRHAPLPTPRSIPAWAWALLGLVLGLLASATGVLLERNHLRALDDERLSQLGHDSVALLQRQFEDSALLLRAVQSAYSVSDSISEPHFESMLRDLRPPTMLPSLVALAFARRQPGAPGHYRYERVAPVAGNASLLGFDAAAQPANMRALERARSRRTGDVGPVHPAPAGGPGR